MEKQQHNKVVPVKKQPEKQLGKQSGKQPAKRRSTSQKGASRRSVSSRSSRSSSSSSSSMPSTTVHSDSTTTKSKPKAHAHRPSTTNNHSRGRPSKTRPGSRSSGHCHSNLSIRRAPSMDISNMEKNVRQSRLVTSSSKSSSKSEVAPRSRIRIDPRTVTKESNSNIPEEASAENLLDEGENGNSHINIHIDPELDPDNIYNNDVRYEFSTAVMSSLVNSPYNPEKFLKPLPTEGDSYLDRHVKPKKEIDLIVEFMKRYYDLSKDKNPLSSCRRKQDETLWDSIAFILPMLCRQVIEIVRDEPFVVTDVQSEAIIFGDLHGNLTDLYYIYKHFISQKRYEHTRFVFLGDYVDRGPKPVEILTLLFALKLNQPKRFILLRGNHEVMKVNRKYGFQHMCCNLFLDTYISRPTLAGLIYKSFNRTFCYLPVAAVIRPSNGAPGGVFCCHGGIPKQALNVPEQHATGWKVEDLNKLMTKPAVLAPSKRAPPQVLVMNEILWNDPIPVRLREKERYKKKPFYRNKKRGGHCSFFTGEALESFLEANHLSVVVRGHQYRQCIASGFKSEFEGRLVTVFSSSNYCGTEINATGYALVNGPKCTVHPHTLRTAAEAEKYRKFNDFKMVIDQKTKEVTHIAF